MNLLRRFTSDGNRDSKNSVDKVRRQLMWQSEKPYHLSNFCK